MTRLRLFSPTLHGERGTDGAGSGCFCASRGNRLHCGRDYLVRPGGQVRSPVNGVVGRIGQCYPDDPVYKLVEIQHEIAVIRVLYVEPIVTAGQDVYFGDTIGHAQDITRRYSPLMQNHVHMDVRLVRGVLVGRGEYPDDVVWIDPELFIL